MIIENQAEWPKEEAREEARYFIELINQNESIHYLKEWIERNRDHWIKVFNDEIDFIMFADTFNEIVSPYFSTRM